MLESAPKSDAGKMSRRAIAVSVAGLIVYALLILYHISAYQYNPSSMIRFGVDQPYFDAAALEPDLIVFDDPDSGGVGYDGQFYYFIIKDFFMGEEGIANPFRSQRILYPILSYALALGRADLLPLSMPAVNLLAIAISGLLLWSMIRADSTRPEIMLLYTLNIGFMVAVFYDLATPLCVALTVAGAYFFFKRKSRWGAAVALGLAMLAQENAVLVIGGLCLWLVWEKDIRGAATIAASMAPWAIWQAALWQHYGTLPALMSGGHFTPPFFGMISQTMSLSLPGGLLNNMRELSVYPFMALVIVLLGVGLHQLKTKPSALNLLLVIHALAGICFNHQQIWSSTITSPARALATVFPFIVMTHAREKSTGTRLLVAICILLAAMGILRILFLPEHPFYVTQ
jgi:hypothetical protein